MQLFEPFSTELEITRYTLRCAKLTGPVRLVLLSDLHGFLHGSGQQQLAGPIRAFAPDAVLYAGDILDDCIPFGHTLTLFEALRGLCPAFYAMGNHECHAGLALCKATARHYGIRVLAGDACRLHAKSGAVINVCGVDDSSRGSAIFSKQLQRARAAADPARFTILLAHRPERTAQYFRYGFDLVLSGHAHGGHWRIPGLLPQGLCAPNQGLFPCRTCGVYEENGQRHLVGRGLVSHTCFVPRIWNRPELVLLTLVPSDGAQGAV